MEELKPVEREYLEQVRSSFVPFNFYVGSECTSEFRLERVRMTTITRREERPDAETATFQMSIELTSNGVPTMPIALLGGAQLILRMCDSDEILQTRIVTHDGWTRFTDLKEGVYFLQFVLPTAVRQVAARFLQGMSQRGSYIPELNEGWWINLSNAERAEFTTAMQDNLASFSITGVVH